jgi:GTPase SAR1 family protein
MQIRIKKRKKILIIGSEKTGKTSLVSRFLFDYFPHNN